MKKAETPKILLKTVKLSVKVNELCVKCDAQHRFRQENKSCPVGTDDLRRQNLPLSHPKEDIFMKNVAFKFEVTPPQKREEKVNFSFEFEMTKKLPTPARKEKVNFVKETLDLM